MIMSIDRQNGNERHGVATPDRNTLSRLWIGVILALVLCILLLAATAAMHGSETNDLRNVARGIRAGDDILEVDVRLGGSTYGFECSRPPTHHGAVYGGRIDNLHHHFDSLIGRVFGGRPSWYTNTCSKHFRDWPVLVTYDDDRRVTAVYIDGTPAISSANHRTKP